jgi:ABC-type uncharacterized transport system substrate-binding protein
LNAVLSIGKKIQNGTWRARTGLICALRRLIALAALAAAFVSWPAAAATEVLVVIAQKSPAHEEALAALRASLADVSGYEPMLRVMTAAEFSDSGPRATDQKLPGLVVTLGTDAAATVLRQKLPAPTYCTFLPQAAYAALANVSNERHTHRSALYIDQPLSRQMQLIRLALPTRTRVGVVLGPESRKSEHSLRDAAVSAGLVLRVEQITDEKQLVGALHRIMDGADVLLAVPDPLVFNRNTAQNVLLTTYRLGKPVVGYSRAYVTAGALLSVYSTPAQIGRQIGETLLAMQDRPGRPLPAPGYPRYFSVEINERVARSLGIEPGQADDLARRLAEKTTGRSHE